MRVIAGTARSLPLRVPAGMDTRPTTDRIKETLFNILQSHIQGSTFVDLFSGSGGIGIEALSRGAKKAYFVERGTEAIQCIQENIKFTKFTKRAVILKQEATLALFNIPEKSVDIIFMDPPYDSGLERDVLEALLNFTYVTEDTLIIVEASKKTDFSYLDDLGYEILREKNYKTNKHVFISRKV